jgi:hypothetical protein
MQANDPEVSIQGKTIILNVAKKIFRGDSVQQCCSHVHSVRVAQDRNPCLTFTDIEKKSVSNCMKKGEVLKSTHGFILF